MSALRKPDPTVGQEATLRTWLAYVIETAIDMLDALDAAGEDLEGDEDFEAAL